MLEILRWLTILLSWLSEPPTQATRRQAPMAPWVGGRSSSIGVLGSGSGTLPPPLRRLDGHGRASEAVEAQAHGR